ARQQSFGGITGARSAGGDTAARALSTPLAARLASPASPSSSRERREDRAHAAPEFLAHAPHGRDEIAERLVLLPPRPVEILRPGLDFNCGTTAESITVITGVSFTSSIRAVSYSRRSIR